MDEWRPDGFVFVLIEEKHHHIFGNSYEIIKAVTDLDDAKKWVSEAGDGHGAYTRTYKMTPVHLGK